jgi:hypothetical protein
LVLAVNKLEVLPADETILLSQYVFFFVTTVRVISIATVAVRDYVHRSGIGDITPDGLTPRLQAWLSRGIWSPNLKYDPFYIYDRI